jgi:hypothetical protein
MPLGWSGDNQRSCTCDGFITCQSRSRGGEGTEQYNVKVKLTAQTPHGNEDLTSANLNKSELLVKNDPYLPQVSDKPQSW